MKARSVALGHRMGTTQSAERGSRLVKRLITVVRNELQAADLTGKRLVVAVSGGPDSLALLHSLARLQNACDVRLHVGHLDHGLRDESAEDAQFVAQEAERLGVPFACRRVDVLAYRQQRHLSVEHAARQLRYSFLTELACEVRASAVALGHTADDQAETVLLHVLRGSGLQGLRGMTRASPYLDGEGRGTTLFRPLLSVSRQETESFCRDLGLVPRQDVSNRDIAHTRNLLRSQAMPLLRQVNPSVRQALLRMGRAAAIDADYLASQAERLWPAFASRTAAGLALDRHALLQEHTAVRRAVLQRAYLTLRGTPEGLEEVHLAAMERLLQGPSGKALDLPSGLRWEVGYETAALVHAEGGAESPLPRLEGVRSLACPGETAVGGWAVTARLVDPQARDEGPWVAVLDADEVGGSLAVRPRRAGDLFWPLGMESAKGKRLKEFFVDAKVPRAWRPGVPLVVVTRGIAWVAGWRIAHWARLTPQSRRGLRLEFRRVDSP